MLEKIIKFSLSNKLIVFLGVAAIVGFGIYALNNLPIGAVPDITNNQVQIITTSQNLATEDVEQFLTYPVELEMANLPGVEEIRSVSKFGLSIVTIVFNDAMGTYLPRQLIAEKIKSAEEKIPQGFGTPSMGPITTGLGEVYQYTIEVEDEYKDLYSLSDLRTIQDWVVRRQLSGIPGVVEVNTWGGYLKQYEVAINPEKLNALGVSILDAFTALEKNNSISGGGYIEKTNQSYFIRGEGLITSLEDIENIVITTRSQTPVYLKDVATVQYGKSNRFGAITGNGEGEKVMGQIMMLKDADANVVLQAVDKRVQEVQKSLPKGVYLNPFLERSELIGKTTFTIAENLILGCLIVIFVVVLLLGNFRSGLVVASVIPLCLLFAVSFMYIFGVDANLMSMGAIDFGIIIDGAVIIVEFIAYQISKHSAQLQQLPKAERKAKIDTITFQGASKMMNSAVFGQLIIIIVFIPILSLTGVEGKMFKPMALVFIFALIGAMLLCFTYVPVMASVFLKPTKSSKKNISTRLISFLERTYRPVIKWALGKQRLVVSMAAGLLVITVFLYSSMGSEFVPTLDEGDFVIQPILKTGTTLTKTIEATTKMEKILKRFPEVDQVVSRLGAAEVPTDPMSMEEGDVIIKLKPKSEWTSAETKDELADAFKEALTKEIPGIDYEFTQPIEMRFNELVTGVRSDLAIKIFGEDLDILYKKALEVEKLIKNVEGAADISVEKTSGLPQMSIQYNRNKIAKYGLNIEDLNTIVSMAFAGMPAGTVFEGEKQFDVVMRFKEPFRKDIDNIEQTRITLPNGGIVPLSELATITYTKGPAKISRDDTKRRIVIGVNVRNRDLKSVVMDVQQILNTQLKLPTGYTVTYGGQFENLEAASARLQIAVPIALVLIFVLLYFAFRSVKEAALIYSAIPLAAIGGVLLLYLRGLPFSISAGVGFIALFGIAVLNGIVLIEEFNELKAHGMHNIYKRVMVGTHKRLRPVLLTAAAAALGFLPMAISTSAGAEVQKPLATVVIGGLITATILTLVVLPVLYILFETKKVKVKPNHIGLVLLLVAPVFSFGQQQELNGFVDQAISNNKGFKASENEVKYAEALTGSAYTITQPTVYFSYDENNIAANGKPLQVFGVRQSFNFPTIYGAQKQLYKAQEATASQANSLQKLVLVKDITQAYYSVVYHQEKLKTYAFLDSIYTNFSKAATKRFQVGESNLIEKLTAEAQQEEIAIQMQQTSKDLATALQQLKSYVQPQENEEVLVTLDSLPKLTQKPITIEENAGMLLLTQKSQVAAQQLKLQKQQLLPDIEFSVFQGSNTAPDAQNYWGVEAGLSIPIWFSSNKAKVKAAKIEVETVAYQQEEYAIRLQNLYDGLQNDLAKYEAVVNYYEKTGEKLSAQLTKAASQSYKHGEIDFFQYIQLLEKAKQIQLNYLDNLHTYNQTIIELNYLTY